MTPQYEQIHLDVPTEHRRCCPCPDHSTNYVGVAYKSYRLRLVDANGLPFRSSRESCTVNLAGVYPSSEVGDATLAFVRNGEICQQHDKTVLGVTIKGNAVDLAAYDPVNGVTESSRARLTPSAWVDYPQRLRAAGWYALAPEGDVRRGLTWKGRFANVSDTVNYYSPEDEVLKCGYGEYHLPYQREFAWYNQEHYKGTKSTIQNAVDYGRNEGGWAFNPAYDEEETVTIQNPPGSPQPTQTITQYRHATVAEMDDDNRT